MEDRGAYNQGGPYTPGALYMGSCIRGPYIWELITGGLYSGT